MSRLSEPDDISKLGTIMGIWAHPDDETFTSGGIMALAARNGQQIICVTATRGEQGIQDASRWPPEKIADIRSQELVEALEILGVQNCQWLGYDDGTLERQEAGPAVKKIVKLLDKYKPDTILTFGPDGSTGHPDHITVGNWALEASKKALKTPKVYLVADTKEHYVEPFKRIDKSINYFFNLPKPNLISESDCDICIQLPSDICRVKCDALKSQQSQTDKLFTMFSRSELERGFASETFVLAK